MISFSDNRDVIDSHTHFTPAVAEEMLRIMGKRGME